MIITAGWDPALEYDVYHKPIWHLAENIKQLGAVSRPLSSHCFHGGKKYLELSDRNAVAGQHSQKLH